jgi:hypothetical protein
MKAGRNPAPPSRTFRPTVPTLRELKNALFFAVLSLVGVLGWQREGNAAALLIGLAMTLAASWLAYRGRLFGNPALIAEPDKVIYRHGRREVVASWDEIESASFGPYRRGELWLVRRDGPPIRFSNSMTTARRRTVRHAPGGLSNAG